MGKARVFSVEFRVGVARRLVNGESATALHSELGIKRSVLYRWRDAYVREGEAGLSRNTGRPPGSATTLAAVALAAAVPQADGTATADLQAAKRIAELERVIGKQTLQIDFLARAFRRVKESRQNKEATGGTASTGRSAK